MLFVPIYDSFVMRKPRMVSLLLLHLLEIYKRRVPLQAAVGRLDEDRPILGNRHFTVEGRCRVSGINMNGYIEFAGGLATECSKRR